MARLSAGQLQTLWLQAGGSSATVTTKHRETLPLPVLMAAIALAESNGNPAAINPGVGAGGRRTPEYSVGLWQINTLAHKNYTRQQLTDPLINAREAVRIYKSQGLRAWGAYYDNRYRGFLSAVKKSSPSGSAFPVGDDDDNSLLYAVGALIVLALLL